MDRCDDLRRDVQDVLALDGEGFEVQIDALRAGLDDDRIECACELLEAGNADERWIAGLILGSELHRRGYRRRVECLSACVEREGEPDVLAAAIRSLGYLRAIDAATVIAAHRSHDERGVRVAVAHALGDLVAEAASAVDALIALSEDEDSEVRDWAVFGLAADPRASHLTENESVRTALRGRLQDESADVRLEAACALGEMGDASAVDTLLSLIGRAASDTPLQAAAIRVAAANRDPRLRDLICGLDVGEWESSDYWADLQMSRSAFGCS